MSLFSHGGGAWWNLCPVFGIDESDGDDGDDSVVAVHT